MKTSLPKQIYGLIGYPVKHSLSAAMHNAAFEACKIDARYYLFEIESKDLQAFLQGNLKVNIDGIDDMSAKDVVGFNVTVPHKINARGICEMRLVKEKTTVSKDLFVILTGAINTVKRVGDKLLYKNTDAPGFVRSLQEDLKFNTEGKNIFLIGCGGAGRAIIAGLMQEGMGVKKVFVYDNNEEMVNSAERHFSLQPDIIKGRLEFICEDKKVEVVKQCQLLVNATPIGMKDGDDRLVIDKNLLRKDLYVYDVVYNRETQLIKDAKSLDAPAVGGLGMLLYQGVLAWEFWRQRPAPVEVMKEALVKKL